MSTSKRYKLEYLPSARQDMIDIALYISGTLKNLQAAKEHAEAFKATAEGLRDFPYSAPLYYPIRPLEHEYRKVRVKNYLMFYWVDEKEKTITIARVIYGGRDYERLL